MSNGESSSHTLSAPRSGLGKAYHSIRSKMLLLIVGILVTTTLAVIVLTRYEVERGMAELEEQSARNVLRLVMLNIENEYKNLLFHKEFALTLRKKFMKDVAAIISSNVSHYRDLSSQSLLAEETAKKAALDVTKTFRFDNNDYFFILTTKATAISHPDPLFMGKDLSAVRDVKGNYVARHLLRNALKGGGYYSYWWKRLEDPKPLEKLGYSIFFEPWKWTIGTGVYIDDIEADARKRLDAMVEQLKATFDKIRIGKTGYLFLFNGKKHMMVHPLSAGEDFSSMPNPATKRPLLDELIAASKNPDKPYEYMWRKPTGPDSLTFPKESYVAYFAPLDWYVATSVYKDEIGMPARVLIGRMVLIIIAVFVLSVAVTVVMVNRISTPLKELTEYARELPTHNFAVPDSMKSHITHLPRTRHDEVGKLAESFLFMERSLSDYITRLTDTTAAKERIESELNIAHDIQMSILPKIFPAFPDRPEFDLSAFIEPAKEVGGDFYDFFPLGDTQLCFVIADVSGKGVPASLFMAVTKTLVKATAREGIMPEEILLKVNNELSRDNDTCMFVTLFCGILDCVTGEVFYSNGGHNPPLVIRTDGKVSYIPSSGGLVLGAFEGTQYTRDSLILGKGDSLFLYTDGVTEAMNEQRELYTDKRLLEELSALSGKTIQESISGIMESIALFTGSAPQSDDITMLAVQFRGPGISVK